MRLLRRRLLLVAVPLALAAGVALAAQPSGRRPSNAVINACAGSADAAGAKGDPGARGATGAAGPAGPAGPQGPAGPGLSSLESLNGLACYAGGNAGTAAVSYDASGVATITCSTSGGGGGTTTLHVNELMMGSTGAASNEFVEIANTATTAADIGGFKLAYRSAAGTSDVTLATSPRGRRSPRGASTSSEEAGTPARGRRIRASPRRSRQPAAASHCETRAAQSSTQSATEMPSTRSWRAIRPPPHPPRPRRAARCASRMVTF